MQKDYWPKADWQAAEPAALGMDSAKLSALESIIKSEYSNINGIVVVRKGYIAYEKYLNGYGPDDSYHVASVTKSILSALIGIAIDAGCIRIVEQKVLDFFPEYVVQGAEDWQKHEITIRHLLTMTVPYPFADWQEPLDKMCMQADWVKYILGMLGQKGELGAFKYSTAGAHLLSALLTRSTGKSAREFANEQLIKPLGMRQIPDFEMKAFGFDDLFGKNVRGWGLTLIPRDMARFGYLYMKHGVWDNHQIVPETWIVESTTMTPNKYGYLWWLNDEDGVFTYTALGDGGNVICCIPEKDLVVAIASEFIMNPRDRQSLIKEHIISSILD